MTPTLVWYRDGKKLMWDGQLYANREEALKAQERYRQDQFDVYVTELAGQIFVYTRRVASQTVAAQ